MKRGRPLGGKLSETERVVRKRHKSEREKQWQREWRKTHPKEHCAQVRASQERHKYEKYDRLFGWPIGTCKLKVEAAVLCDLCHIQFDESIPYLRKRVDHNHETKKFRGIIHNGCNLGLGIFQTSDRLQLAAAYLDLVSKGKENGISLC